VFTVRSNPCKAIADQHEAHRDEEDSVPGSIRRYLLSSGVALCALLAGPIAGAQGSDSTIISTLNHWGPTIVKDENAVARGLTAYTHHKVKPLVRALNHEVGDLHTLRHLLRGESASSAKGRKAKADIVKGLGLIAAAYGALAKDAKASHGHGVPADKLQAAVNTDKKGRADLQRGIKLLGG
jgi:hypothetical protein